MTQQNQRQSKPLSKLELATYGLVGLSPIPIAGEICGTIFFKRILENTPLPNKGVQGYILAGAVTGLTRLGMYGGFYDKLFGYLFR